MAIMTVQLPLTLVPAGAIEIGQVACLVEDAAGGRVVVRGELVFAWDAGDDLGRRLAAARVPLAGLLLAIPALESTGLLPCATTVFGCLRNGFYGLDTVLVEGVLRALTGEPRAEGAT